MQQLLPTTAAPRAGSMGWEEQAYWGNITHALFYEACFFIAAEAARTKQRVARVC
jgi:hypothetical protein